MGRATSCTALACADPASSSCTSHHTLFACSQRRGISACSPHRSNLHQRHQPLEQTTYFTIATPGWVSTSVEPLDFGTEWAQALLYERSEPPCPDCGCFCHRCDVGSRRVREHADPRGGCRSSLPPNRP